jgi:hypothetical protein
MISAKRGRLDRKKSRVGKGDETCAGRGVHDRGGICVLGRGVKALGEPASTMEGSERAEMLGIRELACNHARFVSVCRDVARLVME